MWHTISHILGVLIESHTVPKLVLRRAYAAVLHKNNNYGYNF